ncbi:hypothetical protein EAF04_008612 [Stromatinia cepivora]|nr:hypothetical protein EAF04_008612 [Stromatinia cepivora]
MDSSQEFREIHSCVVLRPSSHDVSLPLSNQNHDVDIKGNSLDDSVYYPEGNAPLKLALDPYFYWSPGEAIHVRFLDLTTPETQEAAKQIITIVNEWEKVAHIRFRFENAKSSPVRVRFFSGDGGGWSALGTDCRNLDPEKPTMSIGLARNKDLFRSTVLHEFGHVLGCVHEHSSPVSTIEWNRENVIKYYAAKHGWNESEVERQIFHRYNEFETNHSSFDAESVMLYPLNRVLTKTQVVIPIRTELSLRDRSFIRQIYPLRSVPQEKRVFCSWDYKSWERRDPKNTAEVKFDPKCEKLPDIAVGLVQFDICSDTPLRIKASAICITNDGFNIQTETWGGSTLFSAGASWLKIEDPETSDFQTGTFSILGSLTPELKQHRNETMEFDRPFPSIPQVVVWIRGFHIGKNSECKLSVSAHNITKESFEIHINAGDNTELHDATVTWVAYPGDKHGVFGGTTESKEMKLLPEQSDNRRGYSQLIDLTKAKRNQNCDAKKFHVYTGISSFQFGASDSFRLHTEVRKLDDIEDPIRKNSFWVDVKTWNRTVCTGATASWLAIYG